METHYTKDLAFFTLSMYGVKVALRTAIVFFAPSFLSYYYSPAADPTNDGCGPFLEKKARQIDLDGSSSLSSSLPDGDRIWRAPSQNMCLNTYVAISGGVCLLWQEESSAAFSFTCPPLSLSPARGGRREIWRVPHFGFTVANTEEEREECVCLDQQEYLSRPRGA